MVEEDDPASLSSSSAESSTTVANSGLFALRYEPETVVLGRGSTFAKEISPFSNIGETFCSNPDKTSLGDSGSGVW